jgi:hypothetical protein
MYVCMYVCMPHNGISVGPVKELVSLLQIWEFLLQTDQFAESTAIVREQVRFSQPLLFPS